MRRIVVGVASIALSIAAGAQVVQPATMVGTTTMYAPQGEVDGCGLAIKAIHLKGSPNAPSGMLADFSITSFSTGGGVKAGLLSVEVRNGNAITKPTGAQFAWLRVGDEPAFAAERMTALPTDPNYAFFMAPATLQSLAAAMEGARVSIAFKSKGETLVYSGVVQVDDENRSSLADCMRGFAKHLERLPR